MNIIVIVSFMVLLIGVQLVNFARSPPVANAGMIVGTVGVACLVLSCLALVLG